MSTKPRAEAASSPFTVRLSPGERARLVEAATINRMHLGEFLREAGTCAAAECLDDPHPKPPHGTDPRR